MTKIRFRRNRPGSSKAKTQLERDYARAWKLIDEDWEGWDSSLSDLIVELIQETRAKSRKK